MRFPFRRKYFRARLVPLYALALALFALASPGRTGLAAGALLVALGLGVRAWGAGYLVKTDRLVTRGPYAHLRHPLYLGTLLVASGLAAAAGTVGWLLLVGVLLPFFFLYYLPYKDRIEGARLESRYGEAYLAYRRAVPALWPSLGAWRPRAPGPGPRSPVGTESEGRESEGTASGGEGGDTRWSAARYLANDEHGTLLASLVGFGALALRPALAL